MAGLRRMSQVLKGGGKMFSFFPKGRWRLCAISCAILLSGCAFDVVHIRQMPADFHATPEVQQAWTLSEATKVKLREGHASDLRKGTTWRQVGRVEQGDVFHTSDQVVAVEASNQYEADLVVNRNAVVGFYLIVEHTFTAAEPPVEIKTTPR